MSNPIYKEIEITPDLLEPTNKKEPVLNYSYTPTATGNGLLDWAENEIMQAPDGQKHTTLNKVAYTLGGHVAGGTLAEQDCINICFDAICSRNIDDAPAARKTIEKAIEQGKNNPLVSNFQGYSEQQPKQEPKANQSNEPENKPDSDYVFTGENLLLKPIENIPTLWEPFLPQKGVGALAGSSDTLKSTLLRQLGIAVCTGASSFLSYPLNTRHKSVIFALTEDDDLAISYLLNKQNQGLNYPASAFRNFRIIFNCENLIDKLEAQLKEAPADLVVIDAFSDLYEGEMNAGNKVRGFLNKFKEKIADPFNCLILFLHHTGKRTDDSPPSKHNLIGSQAFEAKMRVVIELRKDLNYPELRHLCFVKGNYLPAEYKDKSYELRVDENMLFKATGERIPFEELANNTEQTKGNVDDKLERVALAFKMHKAGAIQEDIAVAVKLETKGAVSKWLNNPKYKHLFE